MGTITGYTAEFIDAVLQGTIKDADVDVNGNLIFTKMDNTQFNAGSVIGPQGAQGPTGATSIEIVTSVTRPATPFEGLFIYETDTDRFYSWNGTAWVPRGIGVFICTSTTRPTAPFEGLYIFETDTDRFMIYINGAWSDPKNLLALANTSQYGSKVQAGTFTIAAISGQGETTQTFNFPVGFPSDPIVIVSMVTAAANPVVLRVGSTTTTQVTVGVRKADGSNFGTNANYIFNWIGIG